MLIMPREYLEKIHPMFYIPPIFLPCALYLHICNVKSLKAL